MKIATTVTALIAILGVASFANASTVTFVVDNGILIGANNVNVNGTLYDVVFEDGTCAAVFDGCNDASDFGLPPSDAFAGATALGAQVFVDGPDGQFDSNPLLTRGCSALLNNDYCYAMVPGGIIPFVGGLFEVSGNTAANHVSGPTTVGIFDVISNHDTSGATGDDPSRTWAKFTPAQPVPEPASVLLFGSGFGAAIVRLRRRKA